MPATGRRAPGERVIPVDILRAYFLSHPRVYFPAESCPTGRQSADAGQGHENRDRAGADAETPGVGKWSEAQHAASEAENTAARTEQQADDALNVHIRSLSIRESWVRLRRRIIPHRRLPQLRRTSPSMANRSDERFVRRAYRGSGLARGRTVRARIADYSDGLYTLHQLRHSRLTHAAEEARRLQCR